MSESCDLASESRGLAWDGISPSLPQGELPSSQAARRFHSDLHPVDLSLHGSDLSLPGFRVHRLPRLTGNLDLLLPQHGLVPGGRGGGEGRGGRGMQSRSDCQGCRVGVYVLSLQKSIEQSLLLLSYLLNSGLQLDALQLCLLCVCVCVCVCVCALIAMAC